MLSKQIIWEDTNPPKKFVNCIAHMCTRLRNVTSPLIHTVPPDLKLQKSFEQLIVHCSAGCKTGIQGLDLRL